MSISRRIILGIFLVGAFSGAMGLRSAKADPKTYQLGFQMGKQGYLDAEVKRLLEMFLGELEKTSGIKIQLTFFRDTEPFFAGVKSGAFDLVFTLDQSDRLLSEPFAYKAFASLTVFGATSHPACYYVPIQSPGKTVEDYKGKKAGIQDYKASYYQMRESLKGTPPESYFELGTPASSGQSALYKLSLGQADIVFVYQFNVGFLKIMNPGPLKKIRELSCAPTLLPTPPLMVHPRVPKELLNALSKLMSTMDTNPAFARFQTSMKRFGMKWKLVDQALYSKVGRWLVDAKKKGWEKDFQKMLLYAGKQ